MRVLDRYIVLALGRYIALSMSVLLVLVAVFLFVNEQGWVGAGTYGQPQALRFVMLQLPATALTFLPVAALLGALLAMGQLARGSEITVMRAAGVSVGRIALSIAIAGLLLLPLALALGEWVAPPLAQASRATKAQERGDAASGGQASWLREAQRLVRADGRSILVFELDAAGALAAITSTADARPQPSGGWELRDAAQTRFASGVPRRGPSGTHTLASGPGADLLRVATHDPRQQSLAQLMADARVLAARGEDTRRQRFAFWSTLARLVAIPLAMLLALPLLLGFLRNSEAGARATTGLVLGLLYFIAQRMVESGAVVFEVGPALLAWLPTLLLATAVSVLLWRARRLSAA